jgi:hypothetical protein
MLDTFFGDVLPATGFFALWDKTTKQHQWFGSQDELLQHTQAAIDGQVQGMYFATAGFAEQAAINGNKDARTQANVTAKKCFYLDLDAGEKKFAKHGAEKVYETQKDAIRGAVEFIKTTGLAPTYLISSGEGLHLYWALEEAIEPHLWTPIARRLSKVFRQHGLKEDPAVTSDSARILRPIGTVHENGSEVKPLLNRGRLYDFDTFSSLVTNLLVDEDEDVFDAPTKKYDTSINSDVVVEGPPKSLKKIIPQCAAMKEAARVKGNVEEPYWRAMLGVVKYTVEGDEWAHFLSSGHPDYSKRDTQFKLDNWKTGPTTCAEFAKRCSHCAGCEHKGKIKSPISLGVMNNREVEALPEEKKPEAAKPPAPTGAPWDESIPAGFSVKSSGDTHTLIYNMPVESKDEDGEAITIYVKVPFTHDIFWFGSWSDAAHTDDSAQVFLHKWNKREVQTYTLDQTLLANQQKFREFLAGKSIHTTSHKHAPKALEEYAKMQIASVKALRDMPKINRRFGMFIDSNGRISAAHGDNVITHSGEIHKAILSHDLRETAKALEINLPTTTEAKYDADVWDADLYPKAQRYVEFMKKYYGDERLVKFQLAAMLGLASPLMPFVTGEYVSGETLPPCGLSVSLYSQDSGKGKSHVMKAVALAYGKPSALSGDGNADTATNVYRLVKLGQMGNYPAFFDEMGSTPANDIAALVSAIANGQSRGRGTKEGGLREGVRFALVALMATNKSARELVTESSNVSNAIQLRLFELNVDDIQEFDNDLKKQYSADWADVQSCAGAFGAVIERTLCKYSAADVNKLVTTYVNRASELTDAKQAERFQYRGLGALLALNAILKSLNLVMFDVNALIEAFRQANALGLAYVVENTMPTEGTHLLSMALHDLTANTAVTLNETRRSRYVTAYDEPLVPVPHVVHARHVVSHRVTYVSSDALRDWCQKHKVSFSKMMHDARHSGVLNPVYPGRKVPSASFNLLKGMRGSTEAMVTCYCVNVLKLAQVTGETVEYDGVPTDNVVHLNQPEPQQPPEGGDAAVNQ